MAETKKGIKVDYVPTEGITGTPLTLKDVDDLNKLKERVDYFVRSEKTRLKIERTFLKSILDTQNYKAPTEKSTWLQQKAVVENVKKFLGLTK